MPVIKGFNWPPEHNNAAAVIVDGSLVFAGERKGVHQEQDTLMTSLDIELYLDVQVPKYPATIAYLSQSLDWNPTSQYRFLTLHL